MTTGSSILDARVTTNFTGTGFSPYSGNQNLLWGVYRSRKWSGADSSLAQRGVRIPASPVGYAVRITRGPRDYVRTTRKGGTIWHRPVHVQVLAKYAPRKKKTKRSMPPNAYTATYRNWFYAPVRRTDKDGWKRVLTVEPCPVALAGIDPKQHYKLLEKLRRRAYGSGWNPGVTLAEMPQAIRMIGNAATRIYNGLKAAQQGSWRGVVRNVLGGQNPGKGSQAYRAWISYRQGKIGLSALWLEIQYGWLPLVGDIEDAAAYIGWAVGSGDVKPTKLKARRSWEVTTPYKPSGYEVCCTKVVSQFQAQYVITNLRAKPITGLPSVASAAAVAWEKMPWSFVCDWVVPVSAYLQALRTAADLKGTVVFSVKRVDTHTVMGFDPAFMRSCYYDNPALQARFVSTTFSRTVSDEISPPTPLPDLSPDKVFSTWKRAANAVALLAQYSLGKAYRWHTPIGG